MFGLGIEGTYLRIRINNQIIMEKLKLPYRKEITGKRATSHFPFLFYRFSSSFSNCWWQAQGFASS